MKHLLFFLVTFLCIVAQAQNAMVAQCEEMIQNFKDHPEKLAQAAEKLIARGITYDPSYQVIPYPNGDIDSTKGTSSDFVIRAYRMAFDDDLQKTIYLYRSDKERNWRQNENDTLPADHNIDHRKVKCINEMLFTIFDASATWNPQAPDSTKFHRGEIVVWRYDENNWQIGICIGENKVAYINKTGYVVGPVKCRDKIVNHYSLYPYKAEAMKRFYDQHPMSE